METNLKPPKRPGTAYIIFSTQNRELLKQQNPTDSFSTVTKKLGDNWKSMSEEEKQPYYQLAQEALLRYQRELAEYNASSPLQLKK